MPRRTPSPLRLKTPRRSPGSWVSRLTPRRRKPWQHTGRARERGGEIIARLFDLLEAVSRRGAYLALLTEYPAALQRVLSVLGASRWAAGYLIRHPQLLDELLDDEVIASPFDWAQFRESLRAQIAAADGAEQQMNLLRHAHQAEVFRILLFDF